MEKITDLYVETKTAPGFNLKVTKPTRSLSRQSTRKTNIKNFTLSLNFKRVK
jgi:hypothetical protein